MEIRTLRDCEPDDLLNAFNESFSDYFVPLQLTKEQLTNKINSEGVDWDLSTGAFKNGKLCGFILHCHGVIDNKKIVYNAGTGVIPAERNQGLTMRMYDFIMPVLRSENVDSVILEVITKNMAAIKTYEKAGFKIKRKLLCYKGEITQGKNESLSVKKITEYDWKKLKTFLDFKPTWQNSEIVLERLKSTAISYGAYTNDHLSGYIIYNPLSKRIQQFGVDKKQRRQKIASTLFSYVNQPGSSTTVINVDENSEATNAFLKAIGFATFTEQFEMLLDLKGN